MTDHRPSIAELQRLVHDDAANHDADLALAAPVLLEITAAAMAYENAKAEAAQARQRYAQDGRESLVVGVANCDCAETARRAAYVTALSKVRP